MFQGKKILLGVTGSIAAYKSLLLVRLLVKEGASVKVIMTHAARDFVTPLSLSTLSRSTVLTDLVRDDAWNNHVDLGRWADCMLIAPLSANSLAKMASGLCDNLLLATYLSATCPVIVAPAMDEDMWRHPSTGANLDRIRSFGNAIIPVENGELASGLNGEGRMAEPETIMSFLQAFLLRDAQASPSRSVSANGTIQQDLSGKRALVTAGPTYEAIDPVRFIGNHSSGKMGLALARALAERGAAVDLVLGPSSLDTEIPGVTVKKVHSAEEMYEACLERFPYADLAIMAAAVADYSPVTPAADKIKKDGDTLILELKRTKDILATLGSQKRPGQVLVGFALENTNGREYALAKLRTKRADLIVLNTLADEGAGFGVDTNKVTIFEKDGAELSYERKPKQQVARDIVDRAVKTLYA